MDFALSEEQEAFRETLRRFLEEKSPSSEVRRLMETPRGFDEALWKQMAGELGLQGLRIPEAFGGMGFGCLELGIAFEEMGRALLGAPFLSTVGLAAGAILHAGSPAQQRDWLAPIAAGDCVASLAWLETADEWTGGQPATRADPDGDGFSLRGAKRFVLDGASADLLVVSARDAGGALGLYAVRPDDDSVETTPVEGLDPTRKLAHVRLDGAPGERLGSDDAGPALARTLDEAAALLAAECVGGAERCLEMAVAYAGQRIQFARPIGSFQAIKHKCAEVLLEVESARVAARWACWVAEESPDELAEAADVAKSVASDAYRRASAENLQIHGGIGFTWEADPQLYLKRAKADEMLLGTPSWRRIRMARRRGL